MEIFVGNLPIDVGAEGVREIFGKFGEVKDVRMIKDPPSGRFKRYAFVVMANEEDAQKAIEEMDGTELKDMTLTVAEARPKRPRSRKRKKKRRKRGGKKTRKRIYGGEDRDDITTIRRLRRGKI